MTFDLPDNIATAVGSLAGVRCEPADLKRSFIDLAAGAAHLPGTVALVSGGELDCARYHILGLFPWLTLTAKGRHVHLQVHDQTFEFESHPLHGVQFHPESFLTDHGFSLIENYLEAGPMDNAHDLRLTG
jgi:hypothetical protein